MQSRTRTAAATGSALLLACLAGHLARAAAPDPVIARGEHLARLICSACHLVAPDQAEPPHLAQPAPPFARIAAAAGDARSLQRFIQTTHWDLKSGPVRMPDPMLTDEDTVAVSRYILSLRP